MIGQASCLGCKAVTERFEQCIGSERAQGSSCGVNEVADELLEPRKRKVSYCGCECERRRADALRKHLQRRGTDTSTKANSRDEEQMRATETNSAVERQSRAVETNSGTTEDRSQTESDSEVEQRRKQETANSS